jgi:hypothetical protein
MRANHTPSRNASAKKAAQACCRILTEALLAADTVQQRLDVQKRLLGYEVSDFDRLSINRAIEYMKLAAEELAGLASP